MLSPNLRRRPRESGDPSCPKLLSLECWIASCGDDRGRNLLFDPRHRAARRWRLSPTVGALPRLAAATLAGACPAETALTPAEPARAPRRRARGHRCDPPGAHRFYEALDQGQKVGIAEMS